MKSKLEIPKTTIEWIINRLHVSVSDEAVEADIRNRTKRIPTTPEPVIKAMVAYAIKHHHKNQGIYHAVVTGKL